MINNKGGESIKVKFINGLTSLSHSTRPRVKKKRKFCRVVCTNCFLF